MNATDTPPLHSLETMSENHTLRAADVPHRPNVEEQHFPRKSVDHFPPFGYAVLQSVSFVLVVSHQPLVGDPAVDTWL